MEIFEQSNIYLFIYLHTNPSKLCRDSPPNPLATPPAGLSQVWVDHSHLLRFSHDTGNLTLTVRQNLRWSSEQCRHADILLLRERLRDDDFLREVSLHQVRQPTLTGRMQTGPEGAAVLQAGGQARGKIQLPESRGTLLISNSCL